MISRDEVIELVCSTSDKDKTDPIYQINDRTEFGVFGDDEFIRFAKACYRKGVEDSAAAVDESICACCYDDNEQSIAEHVASEVRKLLEDTCTKI